MRLTRSRLRRIIRESVTLDIEKGDVILTGKFKNKRTVVKDFGTDDLGQPTINGMKLLKFRIEKLMPQDKWSKKSQEEADLEEGKTVKITKRQLKRIIREEKHRLNEFGGPLERDVGGVPQEELEDAIVQVFFADGRVTTADVFDRLRMDGYSDEDIDISMDRNI